MIKKMPTTNSDGAMKSTTLTWTAPNQTAGPLYVRFNNTGISNTQARVWQPIPATVPALPNTCFFACPDFADYSLVDLIEQQNH
jgi:hypothetical protein